MMKVVKALEPNLLPVFALRDSKSESYGMPVVYKSSGLMIRDLTDQVAQGQSIIAKHPQDFGLFHIGTYDPSTAVFTSLEQINCLGLVSDLCSSVLAKN